MRLARTAVVLLLAVVLPLVLGASNTGVPTRTGLEDLPPQPKKATNAERFRRGLGPLPPTRRDRNKLSPRASTLPCTRLSNNLGTLEVRRLSDGERMGYVSERFNSIDAYTVHRRPRAALRVAVPPVTPFGSVISLIGANPPDSSYPYFGAVSNGEGNLGGGQAGVAYISGTSGVRANSPPSLGAGTSLILPNHGGIESQIWTMNCQTRKITPQWTNSDGSQSPTTLFYDPVDDLLGLTGDLQAFNSAVSHGAYEVVPPQ
ncbi:hypothetical protein DFH09DRAFT_1392154 [Mycena vulgaris]|nr:hypothetical protein DFH09DRAFT_1392154 [Mycena vulgaris]